MLQRRCAGGGDALGAGRGGATSAACFSPLAPRICSSRNAGSWRLRQRSLRHRSLYTGSAPLPTCRRTSSAVQLRGSAGRLRWRVMGEKNGRTLVACQGADDRRRGWVAGWRGIAAASSRRCGGAPAICHSQPLKGESEKTSFRRVCEGWRRRGGERGRRIIRMKRAGRFVSCRVQRGAVGDTPRRSWKRSSSQKRYQAGMDGGYRSWWPGTSCCRLRSAVGRSLKPSHLVVNLRLCDRADERTTRLSGLVTTTV